jgi:type IV pilus assembly protein PilC
MPVFTYKGRSSAGAVNGTIEAADRLSAVGVLRTRGVVTTSIQEQQERSVSFKRKAKVKDRDLAIYTRQFSTMINAGLPVAQCLAILAEQGDSAVLRDITTKISRDVEGGMTLADSFRKHPNVFSDLYINMLQVGEAGGALDTVLQRLSSYIEKAARLKSKVKSAMVYPLTIMGVAGLVLLFMMTFIIPTFSQMFANLGAELPLPTQIVIGISNFTRRFILLIIAGVFGGIWGIKRYYATDAGSRFIDALALKMPVIGTLVRKVAIARFTRTLGTLVSCGVPILEGLRITAKTAGNRVVEAAVMAARAAVASGRTVAEPLRATPVFPPMVVQMINVGEQTGSMEEMLVKVADFYDDEVDTAVASLTSLLEPLMIVFLGVVIGGLVIALYLPIFKLVTIVR